MSPDPEHGRPSTASDHADHRAFLQKPVAIVTVVSGVAATIAAIVGLFGPFGGDSGEAGAEVSARDEDVVQELESLLVKSARGRDEVVRIVQEVTNCSIEPHDASRAMNDVIRNRDEILEQLATTSVEGAIVADEFVELLDVAIRASVDSNHDYLAWIDGTYLSSYPCDTAPRDQAYEEALVASGHASAAKEAFVVEFNRVAGQLDLKQWKATDF